MEVPSLYKHVVRPVLFLGDPEKTHETILALLSKIERFEGLLERWFGVRDRRLEVRLGPLTFPNPIGLAGGFDKNAVAVRTIAGFGFGFIEIGAVTALAQPGNPKPRLYRLPEDEALINRLGFNNDGAAVIARRLAALRGNGAPLRIPLGVNIGRSKVVETRDAVADFLSAFEQLYPYGDFFTLNVSSPNTPKLRDLQEKRLLRALLRAVQEKNLELASRTGGPTRPVLVKIAPDMEFSQADDIVEVALEEKIGGIVATNATAFLRESLVSRCREPGGLSGRPLRALSTSFVRHLYSRVGGRLPIIGVGGVFTAADAYEKIKAGASAVQIYTGFVYEGPAAVKRINLGLLRLLERDGLGSIADAVGMEAR
ncbi:MAG TPA: quinone-dependent dihydroorotate dehydrogenase [candidate division Zixibacteria bacterium]|nr:quinone-dependent dihydroorotate dehydrogenase [candidate division Zixibacteria bacterium]